MKIIDSTKDTANEIAADMTHNDQKKPLYIIVYCCNIKYTQSSTY